MKPATWRALLLTICAAGVLLVVGGVFNEIGIGGARPWYGLWGSYFTGSSQPYELSFRAVLAGGPADRAGMHEGDPVDIRDHSVVQRLSFMGQPLAGRPIRFRVQHGAAQTEAIVVPGFFSIGSLWNYTLSEVTNVWLLLFAALIAWRRPYADSNLLLCTVLTSAAIGFASRSLYFAWPVAWPYVVIAILGQAQLLSIALWAMLAGSVARPLSAARRVALILCYAFVAIAILLGNGTTDDALGIVPLIGNLTLWFDPTRIFGPAWALPSIAAIITAFVCSVFAIGAAPGLQRQRAAWLLLPLAAIYTTFAASNFSSHFLSYGAVLILGDCNSIVSIITPVLLCYAALNRRLIDAGFVLNRTVVFAIVSAIVIGVLILVEWAVGTWLVNASHTTSVVAGMLVALVLGLSMRYIHRYVDAFVDRLFFRKRHEDESALRRFSYEASYITDVSTLLERTVATVHAHTSAQSAGIFVRNGSPGKLSPIFGEEPEIDENDPAIIALSAWHKAVDLHAIGNSEMKGDLALPMISRGRLLGVLVCGAKQDGETYAPDETDALLALAHGVGGALDVLDTKADRLEDSLIAELRDSIQALSNATLSLPDAIAARLRGLT